MKHPSRLRSAAALLLLSLPAAALATQDVDLPRAMTLQPQQDTPPAQEPAAPAAPAQESGPGSDFIDFQRIEGSLSAGIVLYSGDFESDPQFAGTFSLRAPLPWLSRDVFGLEQDAFGLFLGISLTKIERDFEPELEDPDGSALLVTTGVDYALFEDESFRVLGQLGIQFASFGDVTGTDDGLAALVGLAGDVQVTPGFRLVLNPQVSIGGGDAIFLLNLGGQLSF